MNKETFLASAQYNDFKGTAAADRADQNDINDWLQSHGYIEQHESLVGVTIFAGENHRGHEDPVSIKFVMASSQGYESIRIMIESTAGPVRVRCVRVSMNLEEFFGLFKRFSIAISAYDLLGGREYVYDD